MEDGYFLDSRFDGGGHFGGASGLECPSCSLPLLNIATITDEQLLEDLGWSANTLRVLFCWRCGAGQEPFGYRQVDDSVAILRHGSGRVEDDFPYPDYPEQVPLIEFGVVPIPAQLASLQRSLFESADWPNDLVMFLETPRHQFLGKPFVYDDPGQECLMCGRRMKIILTVANDIGGGYIQTENCYVVLVVMACTDCSMLVVEQQCD